MEFDRDLALAVALHQDDAVPFDEEARRAFFSLQIGTLTAIAARRCEAMICMDWQVAIMGDDGQPLKNAAGQASQPWRIYNSEFYKFRQVISDSCAVDHTIGHSLRDAFMRYEQTVKSAARNKKGKKTVRQVLDEVGLFCDHL